MSAKISVIIPAFNEELNIAFSIRSAQKGKDVEIIVVDGKSEDGTVRAAEGEGAIALKNISGKSGQLNAGAKAATGEYLVFLHADTILPDNFDSEVRRLLDEKNTMAGAFHLKVNYDAKLMRVVERLVNTRSKYLSLPYGDQALFMKKNVFTRTGGFPDMPIMEDFVYIRKLRKLGKISISRLSVVTSGRRWRNLGIVRTTLINQLIIAGHYLGVSPAKLKSWYRKPE